jgi:type IV secretory pathway VirB10-like protein
MANLVGPSVGNQTFQRFRRIPGGFWTLGVLGIIAVVVVLLAPVRDAGPKNDPHVITQGASVSSTDLFSTPTPHVSFVPPKPVPSATVPPAQNFTADLPTNPPSVPPAQSAQAQQQTGQVQRTPAPPPTLSPAQVARRRQEAEDDAAMKAPLSGGQPIAMASPVNESHPEVLLKRAMIVKANMVTSIDSTLPGLIIAQLSEDLLDSTGKWLVAPEGSKLIGTFGTASIAQGQARLAVSFDTIQLPDGTDIALGSQPGTDLTGTSGIGAAVDRHMRGQLATFLLLAVAGALVGGGNNCPGGYCAQSYGGGSSSAASSIVQAGQQMLGSRQQPAPSLHVSEGAEAAFLVNEDKTVKALRPWR